MGHSTNKIKGLRTDISDPKSLGPVFSNSSC